MRSVRAASRVSLLFVAILLSPITRAQADTVTLTALEWGSIHYTPRFDLLRSTSGGSSVLRDQSHNATTSESRSWVVFDLSSIGGSVLSATLTLDVGEFASLLNMDPCPPDCATPVLQYSLFDLETSIDQLTAGSEGLSLLPVFEDLGTGVELGNRSYRQADRHQTTDITLNAAGLSAIQASGGSNFAMGGALTSSFPSRLQIITFGGAPTLTIEVPEPASAIMLLLALGSVGVTVSTRRWSTANKPRCRG